MHADMHSIADLLRSRASDGPASVAMRCEGRDTTLAALDRRSSQVAHGLMQALRQSQDRAAVLDTNSETFFELLFGAAKANRVLVPINNRLVATEIVEVVKDAGAQLLFVGAEFL